MRDLHVTSLMIMSPCRHYLSTVPVPSTSTVSRFPAERSPLPSQTQQLKKTCGQQAEGQTPVQWSQARLWWLECRAPHWAPPTQEARASTTTAPPCSTWIQPIGLQLFNAT